jgi:peptidoglycan/LPS O-acetylase OafA/YrhL
MSGAAGGAAATVWGDEATARDPRLDGLRGLAILLVMLYHTTQYGFAADPLARALVVVPAVGWSGVDLFFVLSGFLITGLLLRAKRDAGYYRVFYARRALRILPLYWTALLFFLVVAPQLPGLGRIDFWYPGAGRETWWFWAFLSNVQLAWEGARQHRFLDIAWSLAIEEHFYLLWPWVVRHTSERGLLRVCAIAAVAALALRAALVFGGASPLAPYVLTPCRLDTLATGSALAVLAQQGGLARLAPAARRLAPAALAAFAGCCAWARFASGVAPGGGGDALGFLAHPLVQTLGYTLLCALWGALLVVVVTAPGGALPARIFEGAWLRRLGVHAYALYLFHFFVGALAAGLPFTPSRHPAWFVPAQLALWATAIGASYGLARLTWVALERPALALKRYFPYGARGAMPAA